MLKKFDVIYYAPTEPLLFDKWQYYQTDLDILKSTFNEVIICHNHFQFFKNIFKIKYVYAWWWHRSFLIVLISRILLKKVVCTGALHMFDNSKQHDFFSHHFLFRLANRMALKLADLNIFISKDQIESVTSHLSVNNPQLLYSSVDASYNYNSNKDQFTPKSLVKILYHSHLSQLQIERKGLIALLPAFLELKKEGKKLKLIIVGKSGDGINYINNFCKENNLQDHIEMKLDISKTDKMKLMTDCDLMVNVSYMEGFGNACLEAMSLGLPVAVSRFGASHELVEIKNLISMSVSPSGIKEVIEWYLSKTKSEKLDLRSNVRKYVNKNFNFELRKTNFIKMVSKI